MRRGDSGVVVGLVPAEAGKGCAMTSQPDELTPLSEPERREAARLDARTLARELVLGALRFAGALLLAPLRIAVAILRSRG